MKCSPLRALATARPATSWFASREQARVAQAGSPVAADLVAVRVGKAELHEGAQPLSLLPPR